MSETKKFTKIIGADPGNGSIGYGSVTFDPETRQYLSDTAHFSSYIFPMPEDCKARREARCRRRNLVRKKMRVDLVKEMFREAIDKIDPMFFNRLENSPLLLEDKEEGLSSKYILFSDPDFTDKEFFRLYPTAYHLRQACLNGDVHDPRLLFLACLSIIKHPGHFLNKGVSGDTLDGDMTDDIATVLGFFCEEDKVDSMLNDKNLTSILLSKAPRKQKKTADTDSASEETEQKDLLKEFFKEGGAKRPDRIASAIRGGCPNCKDLFDNPEYKDVKVDFSSEEVEAQLDEAAKILEAEEYDVIEALGALYSWAVLKRILIVSVDKNTDSFRYAATISEAKVAGHKEYRRQLKKLKKTLRKVLTAEEYQDFFYGKNRYGYSYYSGHVHNMGERTSGRQLSKEEKNTGIKASDSKKTAQEIFYGKCKEYLERVPEDKAARKEIEALIEDKTFLIPARTKLNATIPHQLQEKELSMILERQKANFPFLSETDESGLTVSERIMAIAFWRIPYWAGPLGVNSDPDAQNHSWVVRKKQGAIRPWNFEEMVDTCATITAFISRQAGRCTYFPDEMVMASSTIIYSAYMVLNELNKVKVRGEFLTVSQKQQVFNDLFCNKDRITLSMFVKYLNDRETPWFEGKVDASEVTGLVKKDCFAHSMKSYRFLRPYIENGQLTLEDADDIISLLTIFPESTKALDDRLQEKYGDRLSEKDIAAIKRLKCSGWGRFSRHYLLEIKSDSPEFPGEKMSLMKLMWETNNNQMELMSSKYSFAASVPPKAPIATVAAARDYLRSKGVPAHVVGAFANAFDCAIREMDWCEEHYPDTKISACYIESPRFDGEKKKETESRKKKLERFYDPKKNKDIKSAMIAAMKMVGGTESDFDFVTQKFMKETDASLRSDRRYMYYLQLGRCMYTGEFLNLEDVSQCDKEHIYPESLSGLNSRNLVLVKKIENSTKSNSYPIEKNIQDKMEGFWKSLLKLSLLDPAVYEKLTRTTPLTQEELEGFRDRHLNMTSWTTLLLKDILEQYIEGRYGKDGFPVRFVQSGDVSVLRNEIGVAKCRNMNDQHHAVDAFLACVTGNTLYTYYSSWYLEKKRKGDIPKENNDGFTMKNPFNQNIWGAWERADKKTGTEGTRESVRKIAANVRKFRVINKTTYGHGQFHDAQQVKKGGGSMIPQKGNHPVILRRIKELMDQNIGMMESTAREIAELEWTDKYGGYCSLATSHFVKYRWTFGEMTKSGLFPVPIIRKKFFESEEALINAIRKELPLKAKDKGAAEIVILDKCVKKNTVIRINGYPCLMAGRSGNDLVLYNKEGILDFGNTEKTLHLQTIIRNVERFMATRKMKREVDPEYDKLKEEDVLELFEAFVEYVNSSKQKGRPGNERVKASLADTDKEKMVDTFKKLTLTKRVELLSSLETYFGTGSKSRLCNLETLNKGTSIGSMVADIRKLDF